MEAAIPKTENQENEAGEQINSEMNQPLWSVITYESVAVSGLTYAEALEWVEKLQKQKVSGLCIVTDSAARRAAHE